MWVNCYMELFLSLLVAKKAVRKACCFLVIACSWSASAQQLVVEQFEVSPVSTTITRTGKLMYKRTVNLAFKSTGYLNSLSVDEGDIFEKGDILASIATQELTADKNAKYAKLLQAKREVNRINQLMEQGLGSEQALDVANTNVETARSAYHVAFYNLEKAQIVAPFDGIVLARYTDLEQLQSPGSSALEIAALENNWVIKLALTGLEIGTVAIGQKVTVNLPNIGDVLGTINRIPAIADQSNLFVVDVLLPRLTSARRLIAGQLAQVDISHSLEQFGYRVPIDALVKMDGSNNAVLVIQNQRTKALSHKAFPVVHIDNQYIFLQAGQFDPELDVVVRGWQHLSVSEKH